MCILILNVSFSVCCHFNNENADIVVVECNRKITQTAVIAIFCLMCLNLLLQNQWIRMKTQDMKMINIRGNSCTQNTLKISFDGVNSLISVVLMNQSNDRNTPELDVIRDIGVKMPPIRFGYLKSKEKANAISWK